MILVLSGHAGICLLLVPVRVRFDYSAHVSILPLVISSSNCAALSYALWEHKRIVLVLTFVVWLANTAAFVYSLCLSLPRRTGSPDNVLTDMAITRAQQIGNFCVVDHIVDIRVTATSTLLTDFTFLALMLVGILRWKQARMMGGIWQVMYQQVGVSPIEAATFDRTTRYWL